MYSRIKKASINFVKRTFPCFLIKFNRTTENSERRNKISSIVTENVNQFDVGLLSTNVQRAHEVAISFIFELRDSIVDFSCVS